MGLKITMKYLRKTNQIPKNWKEALRLWRIIKKYPNEIVFCVGSTYYYEGVLLQLTDEFDYNTIYYKKYFWEIKE